MKHARWIALALIAAVACAAHPAPSPETPPLSLVVDNQGYYDANVYVLSNDAVVRKVGTVGGFSKQHYTLTGWQFAPGQQVGLYAKTVAEDRVYRSEGVQIAVGYGLVWTIDGRGYAWLVPVSLADSH